RRKAGAVEVLGASEVGNEKPDVVHPPDHIRFPGAWRVEGRPPYPVDIRAIGSRPPSVRRLRTAHLSPGAGADWIRMLEAPAKAPANSRHSDGTQQIANRKPA